ncbi:protein trapped in endoderm-1-like [Anopheles ziemanni]|uniref:protein trapped in endoderm-1-like n=1 Tax=Anopheles coustani TaxID=139045 RepID=UPI002659B10E|nr:protein trapped in endoderm-1-like [Anopheles coustani]XP_058178569.1 protein trapped in endoderm-1-like [Anopheles ziemanni]
MAGSNRALGNLSDTSDGELLKDGVFCSKEISIVAASSATVIAVLGTIGNVTTLLALGRNRAVRNRRRQPTTAFVLSLATADLLFCVAVMPLMALRYARRRWPFFDTSGAYDSVWCRLFPVALYGTVATSVLSLVALTVNRYVLIVHPSWYGTVYRRPGVVPLQLAFCWAIPYGLMAMPLFEFWGRLGFDRRTFSCTVLPSVTAFGRFSASPKKFIFIVGFALPFCAIVLCYTAIIAAVRRQRRNMQRHAAKRPVQTPASPNASMAASNDDDERHLTRTTAAIFGCFMLTFLPLTIANVLLEDADSVGEAGDLHVLASILTWHSAVLNPFIYALGSRHYRNAYWAVLRCQDCKNTKPHRVLPRQTHASTMSPGLPKATKFRTSNGDMTGSGTQTNSDV